MLSNLFQYILVLFDNTCLLKTWVRLVFGSYILLRLGVLDEFLDLAFSINSPLFGFWCLLFSLAYFFKFLLDLEYINFNVCYFRIWSGSTTNMFPCLSFLESSYDELFGVKFKGFWKRILVLLSCCSSMKLNYLFLARVFWDEFSLKFFLIGIPCPSLFLGFSTSLMTSCIFLFTFLSLSNKYLFFSSLLCVGFVLKCGSSNVWVLVLIFFFCCSIFR